MSNATEAVDEIQKLKDEITGLKIDVEALHDELEAETDRADDAESEADSYYARIQELEGKGIVQQLSDIRKEIKSGHIDDAVYHLEKVLNEMDGGSRTWWTM